MTRKLLGSKRHLSFSAASNPHIQKINLSFVIEFDFAVHMFCRDLEMNTIGNYKIPKHVTDQNTHEILMENTKKMDKEQPQTVI